VITYTQEEIERFIEANKEIESQIQSRSMQKLLSIYHKIKIFDGLDKNDLKAIIYKTKFQQYEKGDYIMKEGDFSDTIYYLIDGKCKMVKNSTKIAMIHAGETFGDNGLLLEKTKRIVSVTAESQKVLLLSFKIDHTNTEFGSQALVKVYQNIMKQLRKKLEDIKFA